jgi:endonuclease/exonuclease/phosphatase (EEP) superfamily protein YafD
VRIIGWLAAAALVALAALRQAQLLDTSWEIAAIGISPWALVAALPLGVAAAAFRRWLLAVVCALLLVSWSVWAVPDFWPIARATAASGPPMSLFDANVSQSNRNLTEIGGEIARSDADVVVLEELTPWALSSLDHTGALRPYRWSVVRPEASPGGMGLWSRIPARDLGTWTVGGGQIEVDGWVTVPGGRSVRVDGVHVYAPAFGPDQPAAWRLQLAWVRLHLAGEPRPLVVAGDFNATSDLRPFQQILHLGLSDTAALEGQGWRMTWPRNQPWVVPYLRLDHVLISGQLTVISYHVGVGRGSDHHPIVVAIASRANP